MPQYLLSPSTYVCVLGDRAVFLDLKRDKYIAVEADDARILRGTVDGWPGQREIPETLPNRPSDAIARFLSAGLLTADGIVGKPAHPTPVQPVTSTIDDVRGQFPKIDFQDVLRFLQSWMLATLLLKLVPLKLIVRRVQRRKERGLTRSAGWELRLAHRLMLAYFILRPNFFSAKDACLRDSLTFVEFLACYDLYPTWVFGVRMDPFAAHCWVQEGEMVLNDYIAHVTRFAPIMAI